MYVKRRSEKKLSFRIRTFLYCLRDFRLRSEASLGVQHVQMRSKLGAYQVKKRSKSKNGVNPGAKQVQKQASPERSKLKSAACPKTQQIQDQNKSKSKQV
jgi:hypothetical protein